MPSTRANPRLLALFHALQMSLFPMAILTVYFRHDIGMSMTQILLLQGAFGLAMALFEFPSGYLADRIGYRRALLVAAVLNAVGWSIYVRAASLPHILVAEVVLGIGMSLVSGTDSALLYESLVESGEESEFARWLGRVRFFGQFGEGTAAVTAGFMYAAWHRMPFLFEALIWVVNFGVAWRLVEPARHRPALEGNWRQVKAMLRHVLVGDARLLAIVFLIIVLGMASFVPVWTIQLYATDAGMPASALGIFWAVANYTVALSSLASARVSKALGLARLCLLCIGLIAVGYLGMGLVHVAWGAGFYLLLTVMRGLNGPVLNHEEHRRIPSSDRAGFISLRSLVFRCSFLLIAAVVGPAIDASGQRPVLFALGAALTLAACLALGMMRRSGALGEPVKS